MHNIYYNMIYIIHRAIRKLLAIPFLSAEHMGEAFQILKEKVQLNAPMAELCAYIEKNWFQSAIFQPKSWSVYGRAIRTNNMVEGWHNRLITRAGQSNLHMYRLIELLYQEAKMTRLHHDLATQGKIARKQKRKHREQAGQIMGAWEKYADGSLTTAQRLRKVSQIYSPGV